MKKSISVILVALSFFKVYGIYEYYAQCNDIVICAADEYSKNAAASILKKCALKYSFTQELTTSDDQTLYILAGDLAGLKIVDLPKYYIVYQTQGLSSITERDMRVLDKASAVWDAHWSNINKYSGRVKHWYYLPNEDYEFVDPVVLSCFLPLRALPVYKELLCHSNVRNTDFSSHIPVLFCHCLMQNPAIMVESGIRWGDGSTISFAKVLDLLDTYLIGLDIEDCSQHYRHLRNAQFILIDDVLFPFYFKKMNVKKDTVDLVFIDTSHQYEHTLQEIDAFSSILSDNGVFIFHDSNVAAASPVRINGTACPSGTGNPKGVTEGLKTYFDFKFDEAKYINTYVEKGGYVWNFINYPYCYGLAVVKRVKRSA